MKRKIKNYLNSKDKIEYSNLDRIFELYLSGDIKKLLSKYAGVGVYPTINKLGKTIQLNYNYHNIYVIIDFFEDKYNVVVYHAGINIDDLEKLFIDYDYQEDFNLENLIKEIDEKVQNHPKLKDTTLIEKKKKTYTLITWVCWCFPIIVCGGIAIYGFTNDKTIKVDPIWAILFIALPLIIGCIFDVKSKKLK